MNEPNKHHYIPRCYLKHFSSQSGLIWQYERNGKTREVSIRKRAGMEKHFYAITNEGGSLDMRYENYFQKIENDAAPVIDKLNNEDGLIAISFEQKWKLAIFLSALLGRTPMVREQQEKFAATILTASEIWARIPDSNKPNEEVMKKLDEEAKRINANGFVDNMLRVSIEDAPLIAIRKTTLLKSDDREFITSDTPFATYVLDSVKVGHEGILKYAYKIYVPLGSYTTLVCSMPDEKMIGLGFDDTVSIESYQVDGAEVDRRNKDILTYAHQFLYSASNDPEIKKSFDATRPPAER